METYILFAIASALFSGLYSFILKLAAQYNFDPEKTVFYTGGVTTLIGAGLVLISQSSFEQWPFIVLLAIFNGVMYYVTVLTRILSLKHIHTTIYFPIYKTFGPIFATIVGIYFFKDQLSMFEMWGIGLGIIVPLLLITKAEDARQSNLVTGLWLTLLGAFTGTIAATAGKILNENNLDQITYVFLSYSVLFIVAGIKFYMRKPAENKFSKKHFWKLVISAALIQAIGFYTFVKAMEGAFAVAFTINAFSILVPIVLSVWFFKEHMNWRKGIVIGLSIVSIIFFGF